MTLRPIQGAPIDAPIPDFPTGHPTPLVVPAPRFTPRAADSLPTPPVQPPPPAAQPGPVEIAGTGNSTLTFRCIPELPAISRSSMTISIMGEPTGDYAPQSMPHLTLTTDKAKAFLLALRGGDAPVITDDGRTGFELRFAVTQAGPGFTISKPGQAHTVRRFDLGWSFDVTTMAQTLLTHLGP